MRRNLWLTVAAAMIVPVLFGLSACAKNTIQSDSAQIEPAQVTTTGDNGVAQAGPADPAPVTAAGSEYNNENIHFDFDSAVLSDQAQRILMDKADYLRLNPEQTVTVEGHCDERGTAAYNIALGDRRAKSAKDFLVNMGIGTDRLKTISYGEERPLVQGRDEASWAENRRAQFEIR